MGERAKTRANLPIRSVSLHQAETLRSQSGQSLLEVALLLPLLVLLLMGTVDLGRYAYIGILVWNAAEAGALYGAQGLPFSTLTNGIKTAAVNDYQNNGQNASNLTVSSSTSCGCDSGGTITTRSEEHTSELQSHLNLVCRLLLEKKKNTIGTPRPQLSGCNYDTVSELI